jgi:long-chain acyl-CoA synthetase
MALNLAVLLSESAAHCPDRTAIVTAEARLTYVELNAAANRVANALRSLGVQRGDKVALMLPNVPEFPIIYFGILKLGATVVPLNVLFKSDEVHYHLEDSDAVALFIWEDYIAEAHKAFDLVDTCRNLIIVNAPGSDLLPDDAISFGAMLAIGSSAFDMVWTMPDDTAVILYTAGTTGYPKGAELTHLNMFLNASTLADRVLDMNGSTVGLAALPLFYSFGQTCVMNALLYAGGSISMLSRFDGGAALEAIERDQVTYFAGVPTMFRYLLDAAGSGRPRSSSLVLCVCGGAPLPDDIAPAFERRFGLPLLQGYGLAETSPVVSLNPCHAPRPGSIGLPIWGTEVRLVDSNGQPVSEGEIGEIVVRGHNVMKGYLKRPEATAEVFRNSWFHTGDIGRQDKDGYLYIVDRKKDVINRGGFYVYPREVEAVLRGHPAVAEAAVSGIPDKMHGEEVHATVVLRPNAHATAQEMIAYCRERMAAYKYPRYVEFSDALPKDLAAKVTRRNLRE